MNALALEAPCWTETEFVDLDLGDARLNNEYVCPQGLALPYSTTNRVGYREYKSNAQICRRCPVRAQCTNSANAVKVVTRHVWERAKERGAPGS